MKKFAVSKNRCIFTLSKETNTKKQANTMTTQKIKTQRIAIGYYKGSYKNVEFTLQKVSDLPNNEIAWYWQIGNKTVEDWQTSKFHSLQAVISYIDEGTN